MVASFPGSARAQATESWVGPGNEATAMDSAVNLGDCFSMQVMLLGSSQQLPSSVLVRPSPSGALLLGTRVGPLPGE